MTDEQFMSSLLPSPDEISKILEQTLRENPSQYATVALKIALAQILVRGIDKYRDYLMQSIKQFEDEIYGNKT